MSLYPRIEVNIWRNHEKELKDANSGKKCSGELFKTWIILRF